MGGSGQGTPVTGTPSGGGWSLVTAPTIEPLTLVELADHLRIDTDTFAESITTSQSILPGSHAISALGAYTHVGAGVSVIGKQAVVNLNAGTVGAGGTVEAKIQESDDNATWTDWTGGGFTLVNLANDNAIQEKAYTGTKTCIRVVAKVLVAACEFGADIITQSADSVVSDDLTDAITDGREMVENITRRQLLTATWDYSLQKWPDKGFIKLPGGNLQTVTSVKWKDTDGTEATLAAGTDYLVETNGEGIGKVVLPYGISWPSGTLYPSNPIVIRFVAGWTAAASLPKNIKRACKFASEDSYYHGARHEQLKPIIDNLLASYRLHDEF